MLHGGCTVGIDAGGNVGIDAGGDERCCMLDALLA